MTGKEQIEQLALDAIGEALQILQARYYGEPGRKFRMKHEIALALFRRHLIDAVATGRSEARFYQRESQIQTSWSADGKTRAYWYQLADEVLNILLGHELTPLPEQTEGNGRL